VKAAPFIFWGKKEENKKHKGEFTNGITNDILFPSAAGFEGGRFAVLYGKIETVVLLG
jgi:hypothetical protein